MKQAINTRTQEEYDSLMRYYETQSIPWRSGDKATAYNGWDLYGEDCCVILNDPKDVFITQCDNETYKKDGYEIIPYTEFAKANIEPEIDYKALYLEGRKLLQRVKDRYWRTPEMSGALGEQIEQFLTNHKDGE